MTLRLIPSAVLAIAALSAASPARAGCDLSLQPMPAAKTNYDPFSPTDALIQFDIAVRNQGDAPCDAEVTLRPIGGSATLNGPGASLPYSIDAPVGLVPGAVIGPVRVNVGKQGQERVPFVLRIPAGRVVTPGSYLSEMEVDVRQQDRRLPQTRTLTLDAEVAARAQMSVSGTSAPGRGSIGMAPPAIDFGTLETGENRTVFVNLWSNASVRVRLESQNRGVMRHVEQKDLPPISYGVTFDNAPQSLAGPVQVQRSPPMSMSGASYPLTIVVGDVSGRYSGKYSDVITISIDQN